MSRYSGEYFDKLGNTYMSTNGRGSMGSHSTSDKARASTASSRRSFLTTVAAFGSVSGLAGCLSSGQSSPESSGTTSVATESSSSSPVTTGSADFDCTQIPTSLVPFDSDEVSFTFGYDAPDTSKYGLFAGESNVERIAGFYFDRAKQGSRTEWDFYVSVSETLDTYSEIDTEAYRDATQVDPITFDGVEVPVTHVQITEDHEQWVLALPAGDEYRKVDIEASVMPDEFNCLNTVTEMADEILNSIRAE